MNFLVTGIEKNETRKVMIKSCKESDIAVLLEILRLNVPDNFAPSEIADFQSYIQENLSTYFIIEKKQQIVGGFGYQYLNNQTTGTIKWIFTNPEYKGTGLGSIAVNFCLQTFRENKNIKNVIVDTSQLASQFFTKFGFEIIKEEKNYWGKGLDLVQMNLRLG